MSSESFIYTSITILLATFCLTWLMFFTIFTLSKYTDFGKETKKKSKKREKIQNSQDDVPIKNVDLDLFKPKIETSFGERRIGEVHEHEKKT
tara:strand:+ start:487 stop:762 length:276 start_codon:yes stop_codon:yes gene_type:complete